MFNHKYELEHVFSFGAALETEAIGPVAEGIRVNFYCQGGEVTGPKLQGRCGSVGGDWLTVRTDGVAILDARTTIESHDGALIAITYSGVADLENDGYQRFLEGNLPARLGPELGHICVIAQVKLAGPERTGRAAGGYRSS
jgi:hypothetical protein